MNVGGIDIPFVLENKDSIMKDHRYEGWFYGGGLSVGCLLYTSIARWRYFAMDIIVRIDLAIRLWS